MHAALLFLAGSLLLHPLHLGDEPPPLAAARRIVLTHAGVEGSAATRTREAALELAEALAQRIRAGTDFARLSAEYSAAPEARTGGEMGAFVPGVLAPELDAFLFGAGIGEVSAPFALPSGVVLLQRVESHAAVLRIQVAASGDEGARKADLVRARLAAGEEFAAVARDLSDDRASAARGGQFAIFERGRADILLKRMAFEARIGEVIGPVEIEPLGLNWIRRVPLSEVDPALRENPFVRLRAILFPHDTAQGADPALAPGEAAAKAAADRALARSDAGEDFRALARELTGDTGGRERDGDLGWVHRGTPGLSDAVRVATLLAPGQTTPVLRTPAGWVILKRDS